MGIYYKQNGKWVDAVTPPAPPAVPRTWFFWDRSSSQENNFIQNGDTNEYTIKPDLRQFFIVGDTLNIRLAYSSGMYLDWGSTPIPGISLEYFNSGGLPNVRITGTISGGDGLSDVLALSDEGSPYFVLRTKDGQPIPIRKG